MPNPDERNYMIWVAKRCLETAIRSHEPEIKRELRSLADGILRWAGGIVSMPTVSTEQPSQPPLSPRKASDKEK